MYMLQTTNAGFKSILERKEHLNKQLTEHLNKKEKKALQEICEDFHDIFHLKGDVLLHIKAVVHEITTRIDSAPVNVRPYRLPEKYKEKVNQ